MSLDDDVAKLVVDTMREQGRDFQEHVDSAKPVYNRVITDLDVFFGYPIRRNEIIAHTSEESFFIPGYDVIAVSLLTLSSVEDIVDGDKTVVERGSEDELYATLLHESFHSVFHDTYQITLKRLFGGTPADKKIKSIDEAFAFWGMDSLTNSNSTDVFVEYTDCDIDVLRKAYDLFKIAEKQHGRAYVVNNLIKIVADGIGNEPRGDAGHTNPLDAS